MRRLTRRIGRGAVAVAATLVGFFLVLAPWGWQRIWHRDPLRDRPGWRLRARRGGRSDRRRQTAERDLRRSSVERAQRALAIALAIALLLWVTPLGSRLVDRFHEEPTSIAHNLGLVTPSTSPDEPVTLADPVDPNLTADDHAGEVPASLRGQSWWTDPDYIKPVEWMWTDSSWLPINPYRLPDFESKYINIHHGARDSWTPPACSCRRLRVWIYGGSAVWGLDQRDDRTIASQLARVAAEHGVRLDVSNRGQLGQMGWMEAERFAWDL